MTLVKQTSLEKTNNKTPNKFWGKVAKFLSSDKLIHIVCFLSVLFIGADLFSFEVFDVTVRYEQVLLVVFALLLYRKGEFSLSHNIFMWLFCLTTLCSVFFAYNLKRSAIFYFAIVYNLIFVFFLFSSYVRIYGLKKFIEIFRYTIMLQVFFVAVQSVVKVAFEYDFPFFSNYGAFRGVYRFCIWFYEPSYYATHMIFGFALALYMLAFARDFSYIFDIFAIALGLVMSTASTGIVGMGIAVVVVFFIYAVTGWKKILASKHYAIKIILKTLSLIAFCMAPIFGLFLISRFFPEMYNVYIQRVFDDPVSAMGGRVEMWQEVIKVFKQFPVFGVGPGCYGLFVSNDNSIIPSNVTLELLSTTGVLSTLLFYAITVYFIVRCAKCAKKYGTRSDKLVFGCALALLVFTLVLQANQSYIRLYHWMFLGILQGALERYDCKIRLFSRKRLWGIPATVGLKSKFITKKK